MDFQKVTEVMFGKIQLDLGQTVNPARKESSVRAPGRRKAGSHRVGNIQTTVSLCSSSCLWFQAWLKNPICLFWECSRSSGLKQRMGTETPQMCALTKDPTLKNITIRSRVQAEMWAWKLRCQANTWNRQLCSRSAHTKAHLTHRHTQRTATISKFETSEDFHFC